MAYNVKEKGLNAKSYDRLVTPSFINIKSKRTKRLSPYSETKIWEKDELFTIIKLLKFVCIFNAFTNK